MLADVSHELRTPLTAMRGYVETLRMADVRLDQATRDRYFATIERETQRLDRLVADLLDLARLENGVGELQVRVFAVRRLFEHVVDRHHQELERRRVRAAIDVAAAADQIVADPDRIEQVVDNLFANALRHTENGAIELRASVEHGACVISIVDSGTGIAAAHLPHVFDRFYKADAARANAAGGSGLGLTIAKAIAERHGGSISVASKPGRTVFTLILPQESPLEAPPLQPASTNL
jgi:signal transduction histidine kinase